MATSGICTPSPSSGRTGPSIGFCCPAFDSPSVFGSLLDARRGGFFAVNAAISARTRQFYLPDTNVLITRFFAEQGVGEIQDFMPLRDPPTGAGQRLIRRVQCVRGTMPFRMRAAPV
jgi:GH15 family glucan-1,4-alpha-glucosidase